MIGRFYVEFYVILEWTYKSESSVLQYFGSS